MTSDYRKKFSDLLRRLFRFHSAGLNFGVCRIMNHRRAVIEKFMDKELIPAVTASL